MIEQPLVSVITASYNSEKFIRKTIKSIINQTYKNIELVITDDCSVDSTISIIEEFTKQYDKIKYFKLNSNKGAGVARNNSIKYASGRFIAFCDSDDQWKVEKIEKQVEFMLEKDLAFSFSSYDVIDEDENPIGKIIAPKIVDYKKMLKNNYVGCLTAIYDTDKVGKIYMPEIRKRQDWALWLTILKITPYAHSIQENLAIYRERKDSISAKKTDLVKYNWIVYRKVEKYSVLMSIYYVIQFMLYYFKKALLK